MRSAFPSVSILGAYTTPGASNRYFLHVNPDSGGHYRVRATVSNIPGATAVTLQSAAPCDLVVSATTAGSNLGVVLRKQAGGAPAATVDTVFVYQE